MSLARKMKRTEADALVAETLAKGKKIATHMGRDDALAHLECIAKEVYLFAQGEYFIHLKPRTTATPTGCARSPCGSAKLRAKSWKRQSTRRAPRSPPVGFVGRINPTIRHHVVTFLFLYCCAFALSIIHL